MDRCPGQAPPIPGLQLANRKKSLTITVSDMMGCGELNSKNSTPSQGCAYLRPRLLEAIGTNKSDFCSGTQSQSEGSRRW